MKYTKCRLFLLIAMQVLYAKAGKDITIFKFNCKTGNSSETDLNNCTVINPAECTYFIIHGWTQSASTKEIPMLAKSYCKMNENANVFLVDYQERANETYLNAADIAKDIGNKLAAEIIKINNTCNVSIAKIDLIGISLGGQVAGQAGYNITQKNSTHKLRCIHGLDPAGPLFISGLNQFLLLGRRLTKTDATEVHVYHGSPFIGSDLRMGTADVYYKRLNTTLNCTTEMLNNFGRGSFPTTLLTGLTDDTINLIFCNHLMPVYYFNASINSCRLLMKQIDKQECKFCWNPASLFLCCDGISETSGQHMKNSTGIFELEIQKKEYPYHTGTDTFPLPCYRDCNSKK